MTLAEAQATLSALQTAFHAGEKKLQVAGRTVEYHSLNDMKAYMDRLQRDINRRFNPSIKIATWSGPK
jgi:hypothetical protein